LGALARAIGAPSLPVLEATLSEHSPKLHDENIAACEAGWQMADALLREQVVR
jgi:Pyruvate/2-oxoacid:ferredoxin oxidoreductase gamma subunit